MYENVLMVASPMALELIKHFEGLRLDAYLDAVGVPTIGYGSTNGVTLGQTLTEPEAEALLLEDIGRFTPGINRLVTVPLTQSQFDALTSFAFNLGLGALGKSTLLKKLNAGDYSAAQGEFDRWVYAGGKKLAGLVRRRRAEAVLFGGGDWRSAA